jgi:hypothetical protein
MTEICTHYNDMTLNMTNNGEPQQLADWIIDWKCKACGLEFKQKFGEYIERMDKRWYVTNDDIAYMSMVLCRMSVGPEFERLKKISQRFGGVYFSEYLRPADGARLATILSTRNDNINRKELVEALDIAIDHLNEDAQEGAREDERANSEPAFDPSDLD